MLPARTSLLRAASRRVARQAAAAAAQAGVPAARYFSNNAEGAAFHGKYPTTMDLGTDFYDKLFDPKAIRKRRKENMKSYPPQATFMQLIPPMKNADGNQFKMYWDGVYCKLPPLPADPDLLLRKFLKEADPDCVVWLMGRAGAKQTYHGNTSDFNNWRIVPRMLTGACNIDLTTKFKLGEKEFSWPNPVAIAPVGVQARVTYPEKEGAELRGDLVAAQGSASCGVPFMVSSVSSVPLEEIAKCIKKEAPEGPAPWFQVYNSIVPEVTKSMIKRAKDAGYGAIVLTLDTNKYGFRTEELDAAYFPQADTRLQWCQFTWDPVFNALLKQKFNCVASEEFSEGGKFKVDRLKANMMTLGLLGCGLGDTWNEGRDPPHGAVAAPRRPNDNLDWFLQVVCKEFGMPLVLKGIVHPEDAAMAARKGVHGIIVSNHGGRQVDGSISTIEALPAVVQSVRAVCRDELKKEPLPVFVDSGVRVGQHVVKALALGATGVLVGRMPIIGAALGGTEGVRQVLLTLLGDTQCTMINSGVESVDDFRAGKLSLVRAPNASPPPFL